MSDSQADDNDINIYGYVPDLAANAVGVAFFGLAWILHTVFGIYYRQWWYGIALFIGCGLETAGFIGRLCSHFAPEVTNDFLVQIICLVLGPAFIMGGVYYMLANFVVIYGTEYSVLGPYDYSGVFITCDIISIVIQAVGGGMAAIALVDGTDTKPGTHIMVAGIAFQVFSMSLFMLFCALFGYQVWREMKTSNPPDFNQTYDDLRQKKVFKIFMWSLSIAVLCVFTRCVYRVVELAEGWSGHLISHEPYALVLDGLMMLLAVYFLLLPHPGFVWGTTKIVSKQYAHPIWKLRKIYGNEFSHNNMNNMNNISDINRSKEPVDNFSTAEPEKSNLTEP